MKNGLNCTRKFIFLMFLTFMFAGVHAQPNLAFYPFNNQFNSFDYNPAFLTSREKFTFSIFPLGGTNIGTNNQKIIKDLASKLLHGNLPDMEFSNVLSSLVNMSSFHQNIESSLLSITYRSEIGFFNFRIKDSEYFLASLNGDITKFIFNDNVNSVVIGQPQYLPIQAVHYREYSLGYSFKSRSKRFSAGIRAKMYYGKSAVFSNISGSIQADPAAPANYLFKSSGTINLSLPKGIVNKSNTQLNTINLSRSTIFNCLFNTGNPGMGVDLGINYNIMPDLSFSISVIDLGKINWKTNLYTMNNNITYPLPPSIIPPAIGAVPVITKPPYYTYTDLFNFGDLNSSTVKFSKPLPATIYSGLKYQVNPLFSMGIADRLVVVKDLSYNSVSLTGKLNVNKTLSISSGYSIIGDSYLNIPLAFLFQEKFGQFFIGTDNLTTILLPNYSQFAGISFGACFYLFTQRNKYLKPSNLTLFYKLRKIIKNRQTGLTIKANQEYN